MRGKRSEIKQKVENRIKRLNNYQKKKYQRGELSLEDCREWHFWIDNYTRYYNGQAPINFARIRWDAANNGGNFDRQIERHERHFRVWIKN